jgi:hypothetical protein
MNERYQIDTVAHKATHDVLTELQALEGQNEVRERLLEIFSTRTYANF